MVVVPRLSYHRHTGRLRPHHETSYGLLGLVLVAVGALLWGASFSADAATNGGGQYTVQAVVSAPRPTKAPVITSPNSGQTFQTNPIKVDGTCTPRTMIKIFKNGILAGSILCGADGRFSIPIDLVIGRNDLTATAYNALDQPGPESAPVTVSLTLPPGGFGFSSELIIQSTSYYRGAQPGEEIVWPIELVGGQAPYAVNVDWGDGSSDLITRLTPGPFTVKHTYRKTGTGYLGSFPLIIRATDSASHTAFLQLTTIINSPTGTTTGAKPAVAISSIMLTWPLWIALILIVLAFWLGERREKSKLERKWAALT